MSEKSTTQIGVEAAVRAHEAKEPMCGWPADGKREGWNDEVSKRSDEFDLDRAYKTLLPDDPEYAELTKGLEPPGKREPVPNIGGAEAAEKIAKVFEDAENKVAKYRETVLSHTLDTAPDIKSWGSVFVDDETRQRQKELNEPPIHYDLPIQPIEYIIKNDLDFLEGNIIKYVSRYPAKGGIDDLYKARVYLNYLIEREENRE